MTPTLKTLIDIRDRAQLAIEAERETEPAKEELPEPKWEQDKGLYNYVASGRAVGFVTLEKASTPSRGYVWSLSCGVGWAKKLTVAMDALESAWAALSPDQKRTCLDMTVPAPAPLPTPLPCICGQSYVPHVGTLSSGKETVSCRCGRMVAYPTRREAIERWNAMLAPAKALLPCPFCGGRAEAKAGQCIECQSCFSATEDYASRDEAIAAWNRRTPSQPDATTKAAIAVAEADAVHAASVFLPSFPRATEELHRARNAYRAVKAAAGKAVQS